MKSYRNYRISPLGNFRGTKIADLALWPLSVHVMTSVFGNLPIILASITDFHLHTPKYIFLSRLSFIDHSLTTTTMPKMLVNIQTQIRVITYAGYLNQMYLFVFFAGLDEFFLAVIAFDCFMAICHSLNYRDNMNPQLYRMLDVESWTITALHSFLQSEMVLWLSFLNHLELPHIFCDFDQMIQPSFSDNFLNEIVMYFAVEVLDFGLLTAVIYSYSKIFSSVCTISSVQGKYKAFVTCASHLSVVSLLYGTLLRVCLNSTASPNAHSTATALVMYTVITPMLNIFIYSLRNKEIMRALSQPTG